MGGTDVGRGTAPVQRGTGQDKLDRLREVPIFADCTPDELAAVATRSLVLRVPKGSVVVAEGDPGREAFVILDGHAEVTFRGEQLATLGPGELFGEMAMLANQPRSATVRATTDVELLILHPEGLAAVIGTQTIAWKALQTLADRVRSSHRTPTWPMVDADRVVDYTLGAEEPERQRLITQAEVWAPLARWLFAQFEVPEGGRVADVACGPLGVLHVLSELVGPDGEVVGIDREPRMLELARDVATERGLDVELVEADAAATGLRAGQFDLVHCRTLLVNVTNADAIVAEMARLTRPGGTVAIEEPDGYYWVCDPPHPAWDRVHEVVRSAFELQGRSFDMGRRIGRLLRGAGVRDVRSHAHAFQTGPGDAYQTLLLSICDALRPIIYEAGRYDAARLDALLAAAHAHLEQPGTTTCLLMWQAWGTC